VSTGLGGGRDAAAWRGTRFFLGAGDDETHYVEETRKMAARMKDVGLDVTLRVENGKHGWGLWGQLFQDAVPTVLSPNKEDARSTGAEPAP
jgi:S-formylglutathione hydrolase FrmB